MKLLLRVLAGESLSVPPLWLMRQAGRYLPEYRALRGSVAGFLDLCLTPDLAIEVTLQPLKRFQFDAAILFSDILIVPYGLGQDLAYKEGEGPVLTPVRNRDDLKCLSLDRFQERTNPIYQTVAGVARQLDDKTTLIGFAGGPWTVAAYMVEGRGGGEFIHAKRWAYQDPAGFQSLIDLITTATIEYLASQIDAGAEVIQIFDSWAGILPPDYFETYVVRPTQTIVTSLRARYPTIKIIGFPRLAGLNYRTYIDRIKPDGIGLDTTVPLSFFKDIPCATQGNIDPILLLAGGDALDRAVDTLREAIIDKPHIVNLGHGILPETNLDIVAQLVERVRRAS